MKVADGYTGSGNVVSTDAPSYLVEFWRVIADDTGHDTWNAVEYELTECDVHDALRWARENAPSGATVHTVIYACYRQPAGSAESDVHILLAGSDPSKIPTSTTTLTWPTA
ncbi:hypothetical protein DMH03_27815 [Amycolatopsis sp. WAC 01376]|uniref:hypothetical protein n=1 Tax=Amycolatopsis sp. WAC 01376 TaxID=2203195 RepID=UPI000F78C6EB|nr:hypothetical protein [Amycolatopsis sp. WAC 01376]RSM57069.1 hypothetical protein DMH03_27815 [Amycolatopsis sp. WAC 01376]